MSDIDGNLKDMLKNINKAKPLSKDEINKIIIEINERLDFNKKIDEINLKMDKYVIFVDGNEELIYENGEFFIEDTIDKKKKKKKKKKSEARDLYIEYFIKYQLNPILKQKEIHGMVKTISKNILKKNKKEKEVVKKENIEKKVTKTVKKKDNDLMR
ncbi:MAG: hypothetical protein RSB67_01295 [Clostridia bacterium]